MRVCSQWFGSVVALKWNALRWRQDTGAAGGRVGESKMHKLDRKTKIFQTIWHRKSKIYAKLIQPSFEFFSQQNQWAEQWMTVTSSTEHLKKGLQIQLPVTSSVHCVHCKNTMQHKNLHSDWGGGHKTKSTGCWHCNKLVRHIVWQVCVLSPPPPPWEGTNQKKSSAAIVPYTSVLGWLAMRRCNNAERWLASQDPVYFLSRWGCQWLVGFSKDLLGPTPNL